MASTTKGTGTILRPTRPECIKIKKPDTLAREHNRDKKFVVVNKEEAASKEKSIRTDPFTSKLQKYIKHSYVFKPPRASVKKVSVHRELLKHNMDNQKNEKPQQISSLKPHIDHAKHSRRDGPNGKHQKAQFLGKEDLTTSTERSEHITFRQRFEDLAGKSPKEFEINFREWMERDEIARSLQSKLRADLIHEFNKSALGKQMQSFIGGKVPKPFSLQPLSFVLHTIVAEFLHAENCHFTLSVFCTEVPYHNALPDFENRKHFRFHNNEIPMLMEASMNNPKLDANFRALRKNIERTYSDTSHSFLYALIFNLVEAAKQVQSCPIKKVMHTVATATDDRMASPIQLKVTRSVGTLTKPAAQRTVSTNTLKRSAITKGTSTSVVKLQPKCFSKKTQTLPLQKQASPPLTLKPKSTRQVSDKATNTERRRVMAKQTGEPELQHLMYGNLISLLRRVRELVVVCEMSLKPQPTDEQLKLNIICEKLEVHTVELTHMRQTKTSNSLEKLHEIFSNLRQCTQSLRQVMTIRSQASPHLNRSTLTKKRPALMLDTATQTESQNLPLTQVEKNEQQQVKQLRARHTVDTGQQTDPSKQTVATNTASRRPTVKHSVATNTVLREMRSVEQQTNKPEKTYEDWVYEMSNTPNGQEFLDRVEASLNKALDKQKKKLCKLYEIKLRHQSELMRMRYKRPSAEQVGENVAWNANNEARQLMDALGKQISEFESRQQVTLDKIKAEAAISAQAGIRASAGATMASETEAVAEEVAANQAAPTAVVSIELHEELKSQAAKLRSLALVLRDHLPKAQAIVSPRYRTAESQTEPDTKITQAVAEAKARIQELEEESSQLEIRFLSYVEHMRHEKDAEHEATKQTRTDCALERQRLQETMRHFKELERQHDQRDQHINNMDYTETNYDFELPQVVNENEQKYLKERDSDSVATQEVVFTNAISEAKRRLFEETPWLHVEPVEELPTTDQLKPATMSERLKAEVKLSIAEQQIAEWNCNNDFVHQHDISHDSGGDGITARDLELRILKNFKAQAELNSSPLNVLPTLSYTTGLDSAAATAAPNTLTGLLANTSSESSNDAANDDVDNNGVSEEWRKRFERDGSAKQPTKIVDLKLSMSSSSTSISSSSSSSSSCSSLEQAFDRAYMKHSLLQTYESNTATLKQPSMILSPAIPFKFTSLDKRDHLERTFAKMQMLFGPQPLLGDESQPLDLDDTVSSFAA